MRKADLIFLVCVLASAAVFTARTLDRALPILSAPALSASATHGSAGQPRRVDAAEIARQLEQGILSPHEAEFYEPLDAVGGPDSSPIENPK